jgi:serine/threonine-protein kinase
VARRVALVLLPLLTLLTGAAIAAVVVHGMVGGQGSQAPAVAAETKDGTSYTLSASRYVGRQVDEVAIQLAALGLAVERRADPTSLAKAGVVTAIDPAGKRLRPGDVVTLTYSTGANAPRTDQPAPDPAGHRTGADVAVQGDLVPAAGTTGSGTTGGSAATPTGGGASVTSSSSSASSPTTSSSASSSSAPPTTSSSAPSSTTTASPPPSSDGS